MMSHTKIVAAAAGILATLLPWSAEAQEGPTISAEGFEHRFIARELPNPVSWGYMVSALADFNGSGRLDYATGVRNGEIYWFENREDGSWQRHVLAEDPITSLGATAVDVDSDGHVDLVLGRYWYRNPGPPYDRPFTRYEYDSRVGGMHDVVAADVSGNGRKDIVVLDDSHGAFWYEIPDDPNRDVQWTRHTITWDAVSWRYHIHGGPFPRGVADLTGNGRPDIVSKVWNPWPRNANNGREHVDLLINRIGD